MHSKGAHGLCLFSTNKEVTLVTRRMSVRGEDKGWSKDEVG